MDVILYIAIALAVALLLFFVTGKKSKPTETTPPEAKPTKKTAPELKDSASKKEAEPKSGEPASAPKPPSQRGTAKAGEEDLAPASAQSARETGPEPLSTPTSKGKRPERDIAGLRAGLAKSRESEGFFGRLRSLFSAKKDISPELAEELEEVLLTSDVGVATTQSILARVREQLSAGELKNEAEVWQALRNEAHRILDVAGAARSLRLDKKPTVILFVGVNGAGKTTTIGKLATKLKTQGKVCVLAAGDTFRAAAVQQLIVWGQRVGCEVVRGKDGADPGSVIFDAVKKAEELSADVVLADTAGRLHTKSNLMAEMAKIARTTGKALEGAPHEILLVIDSTNGQNALAQAKEFRETLDLTGIVLTKLDGTAKGGVLLGISDSLKLPVRFIGLGERPDDLHEFVPDDFIEALLGKET